MKKQTIARILLLSFPFLSFVMYARVNVPINKGREQFISRLGVDMNFENPENQYDHFYNVEEKNKLLFNEKEIADTYTATGKVYKVWVTLINSSIKIEGYLYETRDSAIVVTSTKSLTDDPSYQMISNKEIMVSNINKIKLRKKGSIGRGYLIGTSIGIGTGIIIGATSGDGFITFAAAGMLGIVGSLIGTPLGAIKGTKTYDIHGNHDAFRVHTRKLKASSMVNNE